jgi:hypothetical protein
MLLLLLLLALLALLLLHAPLLQSSPASRPLPASCICLRFLRTTGQLKAV